MALSPRTVAFPQPLRMYNLILSPQLLCFLPLSLPPLHSQCCIPAAVIHSLRLLPALNTPLHPPPVSHLNSPHFTLVYLALSCLHTVFLRSAAAEPSCRSAASLCQDDHVCRLFARMRGAVCVCLCFCAV